MVKSGSAAELPSRADHGGPLAGDKRRTAEVQLPQIMRGRVDGRTVTIVPEQFAGTGRAITLLHVDLLDVAPPATVLLDPLDQVTEALLATD